jgi:ribonuclease-3
MYRLVDAVGPDHEKVFTIAVEVDGRLLGEGKGSSRRTAETRAAAAALEVLRAERVAARAARHGSGSGTGGAAGDQPGADQAVAEADTPGDLW